MTISTLDLNRKKDLYGFYLCDGLKFYSRMEVIEFSRRTGKKITWHFNDEVFGSYDWTKEPAESITELYKKRAQQIRDNYDYLVLFYSSGSDSDNILRTFMDNNIKLDEVVSLVNYEGSKDRLSKMNAEVYELAVPFVKECQKKQTHLKHTIIDITKTVYDYYGNFNFDLLYNQNILYTNMHSTLHKVRTENEEWKKMFHEGKKVAFIAGVDKVRLEVNRQYNFSCNFSEAAVSSFINGETIFNNKPSEFVEMFYWTPDMPEIVIKQAHIVKNFFKKKGIQAFKKSPTARGTFRLQPPEGAFSVIYGDENGSFSWLSNEELNKMIYPYWYKKPYQYKTISTIVFDKDEWFLSLSNNEKAKSNWLKVIQKAIEITDTDLKRDNLIGKYFNSRYYNLGV